jgi:hypothetical protein
MGQTALPTEKENCEVEVASGGTMLSVVVKN